VFSSFVIKIESSFKDTYDFNVLLINSDGRVFNISNVTNYLALSFELVYKILSHTEC